MYQREGAFGLRLTATETVTGASAGRTAGVGGDYEAGMGDCGRYAPGASWPTVGFGQGRSFLDVTLVIDEMAQACGVTGRIVVEADLGAISALMHYGNDV